MPLMERRAFCLGAAGLFVAGAARSETPWALLRRGESVALIRHATAPGSGDPPGFRLRDCSTQRNLSDEGRAQARRIGAMFRANGIDDADVYSSQWCRCLETARALMLPAVDEQPLLNSFFDEPGQAETRTRQTLAWILSLKAASPVVLVTHQVNITGLTGIFPASGEVIFASAEETGMKLRGRLAIS
ncbi:broad specificity phosphatase PhoE [Rhizobium sp. SG_E_25_P2]|uniref:histidine phosphatase family protein n=1 Tax=Rhizobium sp. SG_E_25_P2 TaxID=2879942 RepID=UPI0024743873|nr:histidine phosphatase family protein [Rhizobium sp. SG_E_25_P2]MDH6268955.1 broad specificity phosphatase PhoE [Rhizobium sp. SG_E_25_P2]